MSSIDCTTRSDTGYKDGKPFPIEVVTVDGKPVERETANAYYVMAQAADADGVTLKINSGFRTNEEQTYFYDCYINCNCNKCNLAAKPGYSNHQSGHALDLNTSTAGVYTWLTNNAARFGWERTVPSEKWHWEWWSGGPGGGPCGSTTPTPEARCEGSVLIDAAGGRTDCAVAGAACIDDAAGGPHCGASSAQCPAGGQLEICDGGQLVECNAGVVVSSRVCPVLSGVASSCRPAAGAGSASCVTDACVAFGRAGAICLADGRLGRCDAGLLLNEVRACTAPCTPDASGAGSCGGSGEPGPGEPSPGKGGEATGGCVLAGSRKAPSVPWIWVLAAGVLAFRSRRCPAQRRKL